MYYSNKPCFFCSLTFITTQGSLTLSLHNKKTDIRQFFLMRRDRDSDPGNPLRLNGFQDRHIQPLCHPSRLLFDSLCAEREGFEPSGPVKTHILSRDALSTTQPSLQYYSKIKMQVFAFTYFKNISYLL